MKSISTKKLVFSVVFLICVLVIHKLFNFFPEVYITIYRNGLFRIFRTIYDYLIGIWLPFPMLIISFFIIIYFIFLKKRQHGKIIDLIKQLLGNFMVVIGLFYVFWGWNYAQKGIVYDLKMETYLIPDSIRLIQEVDWVLEQINEIRGNLQNDSLSLEFSISKEEMEEKSRMYLRNQLTNWDIKAYGKPRIRVLKPKGILMRWKTAGIYMPYAFEGQIDGGLMHFEWPYTMTHEMSHAFGITDEGECNFVAFIACMESDDPYFKYSALIDYALYVLRDVYKMDKKLHKTYYHKLHRGVQVDIQAIRDNGELYPDILPNVRDFLYDSYLKSNGVKAGLNSYSQLVGLVINYRDKYTLKNK